jgi:group I intron endonuclease
MLRSSSILPKNLITSKQNKRYYSSNNTDYKSELTPVSILILKDLDNKDIVKSYKEKLKNKGGIYSFINTVNGKQYIGSAKDFYIRLFEHLDNRKSNIALQNAFTKHGLDKFNFCIYEYFTFKSKIISSKALTDLETNYINKFKFDTLYNFKEIATSMLGYKHTEEARLKMVEFYKNKENHPMYGKTHTKEALALISKPGNLNPMFGKKHSEESKSKISKSMSKYPLGVGIYDLNNNLLSKFNNNTELAKHLGISKVTVSKYLNKSLVYKDLYCFKAIQD